ncbi:MAG: DNA-directed RNA polymerase subunit omega [Thermogutta sp.]|nr:DNA-directed RNA polymerase subunit omega [Thermogutta sp.]
MYDELKDDALVDKVGGRFKLSTLIQKRLVALMKGAPPLVDLDTKDRMKIVLREIMEDKIYLDLHDRVRTVADLPEPGDLDLTGGGLPPA